LPAVKGYAEDLAHIHSSGFTELAETAGPAVVELLRRARIESGLVVDLGCGSGITSRVLVEAGYDVLGIDSSRAFLARARRNAPAARFRRGSFLDERLPACGAVLAVGEVLNYTQRSLDPVFGRVYRALRAGGLFVFDLAGPGRVSRGRRARTWREGEDWAILLETEEDPHRLLLTRRMITFRRAGGGWRRGEEMHRQRLHPPSEIDAGLRRAGFRVRIRRGYAGERFAPGHYVVVARKPRSASARPRRGTGAD
jgi:SAM-dependent methyltransferase